MSGGPLSCFSKQGILLLSILHYEAVPIPAMQVTYSNSSTGLCNITVNCSGWMFSVCDGGQCTLYQDSLSLTEVNITVSSGNGFIQCIVNNHVSAEARSQRMEDICIGEKKGIAAASLVGIIVGIVTGGLFLVGVGCVISTRIRRSPKEKLPLKAIVPEVDNPVSAVPGRPEPQNTPGSEVTSIYVNAGRPGAVPAVAEGEEGHPGDKEYTSSEERKQLQSPPQAETLYSTLQIPVAAQRHPVGKGNNLKKPETVYYTIGDYPSILLRDPLMLL
ncbi:uncharacterized protein LOC115194488 isoform X2 [Salmo trutta]|uniref:uncharacterized protein LOC115194488 isoform X2 n=1 Tax=Salmo trutta TaxID=8032 RepID=UPI00112FE4E0|nr:uncharacterized protein LOC115194488 isoform X2 [Salmo trutta]